MAYDLIIFDCDGVLVDSEPLANRILSESFQEIGIPVTYEISVRDYVGLSLESCFAKAERDHGIAISDEFRINLAKREREAFGNDLQAIPGVASVIDRLRIGNHALCVASSGEISKMEITLGITGLWNKFAPHIFSASQVQLGKPHPDLFLFAAAQMGADPSHCAVVEDSIYGVRAAIAAGMRVFGYVGGETAKPLAPEGAVEFSSMSELPGLLDR